MAESWQTSADHGKDEDELVLNAAAAFPKQPVAVYTTRGQLRSLTRRLRNETKSKLIQISNEKLRHCLECESVDDNDVKERFCGAVIVFYCTRHILTEMPVPLVSGSGTTSSRLETDGDSPPSSLSDP